MILRDLIPLDEVLHKVEDKKSFDFLLQYDIDIFREELTERQVQVLDALLEGYKQYEIAKMLNISQPAIIKHKKLIARKIEKFLIITNNYEQD